MKRQIEVIHLDGCGGCQLELLTREKDITDLFELVLYCDEQANNDIAIIFGYFTDEVLKNYSKQYHQVIVGGACANKSLDKFGEFVSDNVFRVKGCPVSTEELIDTLHCFDKGVEPKQKNYPVCKECKERENICLLLEGKKCYGTVTQAGCKAKCTSIGIPCRGCRGMLEGANVELLERIFKKNKVDVDA